MNRSGPDGAATLVCEHCHGALAGTPKFCPECGAPVTASTGPRETRKTVTLLFTDVTGSTAMGEVLDPEAYRDVMGRYFNVAREAVERHGGVVEKFVGDAVLAVFGIPEVREDDAVRAVRAADDLGRAVGALSDELAATLGVRLAIRTGVNTGPVVVGAARAGGSFATGDAVNTAARLEQAAGSGEILLGDATYQLVRDAVSVEPREPVMAKGKAEPVAAYLLRSVRHTAPGRARRLDAPLVGRDREIRALDDALERVLSSGRSHLVTVVGAPGLGKTRLISDFLERVGDRAGVASGRCVSYGQGITFWPIVQVIRSAVRLAGGESPEVVRHALIAAMGGAADSELVVDLLTPMLVGEGVPASQDQAVWAVRRLLEQLAMRQPLVVNIDDLHWAEPTLVELLDRVRDDTADLPLLIVCQARPELLDQHPGWGQGSLNSLTFGLEPFDLTGTRRSIEGLLGSAVPPELVEAVAGWSGGNPLFVEEMVTHLVETGHLRAVTDGWEVDDLTQAEVPPTVSALLAARLDRLPAEERDLLARVAVIGLEFHTSEAVILAETGADVGTGLAALARRDLLRRVRGVDGDRWAFRHLMIREAAYESLPKALRSRMHETFADALEAADHETGAERLAFVGHHLEQTVRLRRELAPHDSGLSPLVQRTARTLAAAADVARDREDMSACLQLLESAAALPLASRQRREILVQLLHTEDLRSIDETTSILDRIEATYDDDPATPLDRAFLAAQRLAVRLNSSDPHVDLDELETVAGRAVALAVAAGDLRREVCSRLVLMNVISCRALWVPMLEQVDRVTALGNPADVRKAAQIRTAAYVYGPFPLSLLLEFTEEQLADPTVTPGHRAMLLLTKGLALAAGDSEQADGVIADAERLIRDTPTDREGAHDWHLHVVRGEIAMVRDDPGEAERHFGKFTDAMRDAGQGGFAGTYQAFRVMLRLEMGAAPHEVAHMLAEATGWTPPYDMASLTFVRAGEALVAAAEGRTDEARALADVALEHSASTDAIGNHAQALRWLSAIPRMAGDVAAERRMLDEALAAYRAKGSMVLAALVERRLAEIDRAG